MPQGNFKEIFTDYFNLLEEPIKSCGSIRNHKAEIIKFLEFIDENKVKNFSNVGSKHILKYLLTKNYTSKSTKASMFSNLRLFLKFAFEKGYHSSDISLLIPSIGYNKKSKIPSIFTDEEILKILGVIDRETSIGKRDYAIFFLAANLGIRSCDICHLKFEKYFQFIKI